MKPAGLLAIAVKRDTADQAEIINRASTLSLAIPKSDILKEEAKAKRRKKRVVLR